MEVLMAEKTLNDLFLAHLKDIYYAEKKIYRTLPKMVKAAKDAELKKAFTTHREETQGQIERLEQVFEMVGKRAQGKPCEAINGIVAEGDETIEEFGESQTRSIPVWSLPARQSNTMRWLATARLQAGLLSLACRTQQSC
jgi:ferritin-like metal-binding protein YciE